jgi:hypothetical protein
LTSFECDVYEENQKSPTLLNSSLRGICSTSGSVT